MFDNPSKGRQARNFPTDVQKLISRSQIVFRTDIFQKLTMGAPQYRLLLHNLGSNPFPRIEFRPCQIILFWEVPHAHVYTMQGLPLHSFIVSTQAG